LTPCSSNPGQGKSFFAFFWLACGERLLALVKLVHCWGLNHAAHCQSFKLSFHREETKKT